MTGLNHKSEPSIDDADPYKTPAEVSDDAAPAAKKFPWFVSLLVVAAIAGLSVLAVVGRQTTRDFGLTRGGPPRDLPTVEVDIQDHVKDFGAIRRSIPASGNWEDSGQRPVKSLVQPDGAAPQP